MNRPLEEALIDVRRAYRLLDDYQKRLLELLVFMRKELGAVYYYQQYRNTVPRYFDGYEQTTDVGRRYLPLLGASIFWRRDAGQEDATHRHRAGDLLIEVRLESDMDGVHAGSAVLPPEQSGSKLLFLFILCSQPVEGEFNWYHKVWQRFEDDVEVGQVKASTNVPGYIGYADVLSLADLKDEDSTRVHINALRDRVREKLAIPFE